MMFIVISESDSEVEFLAWLKKVPMDSRPRWIIIECVASLGQLRKSVQERGTTVVSDQLAELGFCGYFKAPW